MSNIARITKTEQDGIELYKILPTGKCGIPLMFLAQMCGVYKDVLLLYLQQTKTNWDLGIENEIVVKQSVCTDVIDYFANEYLSPSAIRWQLFFFKKAFNSNITFDDISLAQQADVIYQDLLSGINKKKSQRASTLIQKERIIQLNLQRKLGGRLEVETPSGRIDLLTETAVIEIKKFSEWKSAIGQVCAYQLHYPNRKKQIYLFDITDQIKANSIKQICEALGIEVVLDSLT